MKNVIITGASSGFGKLSALTLARKGYKVWATMRNLNDQNKENKEELLSIAKSENLNIEVIDLDVTNQESVDKAIKTVPCVGFLTPCLRRFSPWRIVKRS